MVFLLKVICLLLTIIHASEASSLRCYEGSMNNSKELPIANSHNFMNSTFIKACRELIIMTHGYSSSIHKDVEDIIESYLNKYGNKKSYCAVNWEIEASAYIGGVAEVIKQFLGIKIIGIDYPAVSLIAYHVAQDLAAALTKMNDLGLDMNLVTLIGHSEGAHLIGNTGRAVKKNTGNSIGKIFGLDPAKPPLEPKLDATCANFVCNIHTNPSVLGTSERDGHVDFWPNYGCLAQPGCKLHIIPHLNASCSHSFALLFMADAVKNPNGLQGRKFDSYDNWTKANTKPGPGDINVFGPNVNPKNNGSFYLCTNPEPPYGKGAMGLSSANCECPPLSFF